MVAHNYSNPQLSLPYKYTINHRQIMIEITRAFVFIMSIFATLNKGLLFEINNVIR